jgi:hypothetical protein
MTLTEREELLIGLRSFLEWQKECGTSVWPVDDWSRWEGLLANVKRQRSNKKTSLTNEKSSRQSLKQTKEIQKPKPSKLKPTENLGGQWGKLLDATPPSVDLTSLSNDENGLKKIKLHQKKHCSVEKPCSLGAGAPQNPVLLLEGHPQGLTEPAREMLGKIIEKVLCVSRSKLYWLPYPMKEGCGLCSNLFLATSECISPKVVLLMGRHLEGKVRMSSYKKGAVQLGNRINLRTSKGDVPGVWTHHPTDLLENQNDKVECFGHLRDFVELMRRSGIT